MVRLGFIIGFIALIGVLLSGLAAYRVHDQELTVEGIALARAIDVHASLVQDRLTERELLARVASGLFHTPSVIKADMLQPLRTSIYAFKTDFVVAGWIARLQPSELDSGAQAELASAGFPNPTIRNFDDSPLDTQFARQAGRCVDGCRTAQCARRWLSPAARFDQHPILGPMLAQAMADGKPVASDPLPLLRPDGPIGIVLAAPVLQEGNVSPAGFVTFSYELAPLMLANDDLSLFSVVLKDPRSADGELIANDQGVVTSRTAMPDGPAPSMVRTVTFGGRDWSLGYYAKTNAVRRAQQTAAIVAAIGFALTGIVCGLFGYVAYNNLRLSREIQVRIGFERRLTAVIDELNHRVKNILAVIQSIVTRTLRHGSDIDVARELLIGRIHAMSNVVSLLSESQWQGVKLKGLFEARAIPHAERIAVSGPDIAVSARAAQSPFAAVLRTGVAFRRGAFAGRQAPAHRRALGSDRRRSRFDVSFPLGRIQHQCGDPPRGQRFRRHPARPRRARGARRHVEAVFHRCELCLRTHRSDGDRRRHDGEGPDRTIVGSAQSRAVGVSFRVELHRGACHRAGRKAGPVGSSQSRQMKSYPPLPPITARTVSSGPKSSAPST